MISLAMMVTPVLAARVRVSPTSGGQASIAAWQAAGHGTRIGSGAWRDF